MVMGLGLGYMNSINAINPVGNPYMMGAYNMMNPLMAQVNFTGQQDMQDFYNTKINDYQSSIFANGGGRTSQKTYAIANAIRGAVANGNDTEIGMYLRQLEGDKHLMAGVELAYDNIAGERTAFRGDLRNELAGDKSALGFISDAWHGVTSSVARAFGYDPISEREAFNIVNQGIDVSTTVAANAAKDATLGFGTDGKTLEYVLDTVNKNGSANEFNMSYSQMGNLNSDIRNDYHGVIDGFGKAERLSAKATAGLFS